MIIFWRIRYFDRADKSFHDRDLFVNTEKLSHVERAAIELAVETRNSNQEREFLKFRALFEEDNSPEATQRWLVGADKMQSFCLHDYFEDESGAEILQREFAAVVTGNPAAVSIPSGAQQHDIDFMLAEPKPIPVDSISLSRDDLRVLGYFARDLRELAASAFWQDGPGTISGRGKLSSNSVLETATTDEEIRSFVTICRRLYMENEPANFLKAVAIFEHALSDSRFSKWVGESAKAFETKLNSPPDARPIISQGTFTFTRKRLIDVFLYTQYAHQPDEKRQRQYGECLMELNGNKPLLAWLFLTELWKCSLEILNAGRVIANWLHRYCEHHQIAADVLESLLQDNPGIGAKEKKSDQRARLFREKSEQIALEIWKENNRPEAGPLHYLGEAQARLLKVLSNGVDDGMLS